MNEFERDADTGEVLVRILATLLVRIEDGECRRSAFVFVRQVMVGNDYVETFFACPMKWRVRADAAVDAHDQFVTFCERLFECCLLDTVTFGETMRNVKS